MKKIFNLIFISCLLISGLLSCKKQESYLKDAASYADRPLFVNNSILGDKIGIKLNGRPIESYDNIFLSGPGKFTFYNKGTGAVLLEKEFDLQYKKRDTLYIFQPDSTIAPQLIKNTQASEPAAPEGYMKVKIVNLSKIALSNNTGSPYPKLDVIIKSTVTSVLTYLPIDTLIGVGNNMDTASYYLIKKAVKAGLVQGNYKFSFLDHDTKMPILNSSGAVYTTFLAFNAPQPPKVSGQPAEWGRQVYTIYFSDFSRPAANAAYLLKNGAYYDVSTTKLFEVN